MSNSDGAFTNAGDGGQMRSDGEPTVEERPREPPASAGNSSPDDGAVTVTEPEADPVASQRDELPLDVIFEVLKNERRRRVLDHLEERDGAIEIGELAVGIAAHENDTTVDAVTAQERKRVYVGLYQCHLPKLDDLDIVRYDRRRGRVELAENAEQLAPYRNTDPSPRRPWPRYYGAIVGAGTAVLAAGVVGLAPVAAAPPTLAVVLAALVCCSLVHVYVEGVAGE